MRDVKTFFKYVIPSVLSFALSGIYTIVDGFFVGNSIGDIGLSAVNIAYPIVAVIQALGTGIGMGGAIYYSINKAEKKDAEAKEFTAGALWLLIITSVILTFSIFFLNSPPFKAVRGKRAASFFRGRIHCRDCCRGCIAGNWHGARSFYP